MGKHQILFQDKIEVSICMDEQTGFDAVEEEDIKGTKLRQSLQDSFISDVKYDTILKEIVFANGAQSLASHMPQN